MNFNLMSYQKHFSSSHEKKTMNREAGYNFFHNHCEFYVPIDKQFGGREGRVSQMSL